MRRHRNGLNKEQIIMLSASGFVIMALTMTGVYVSQKEKAESDDGYHIDFSSLEENSEGKNQIGEEETPVVPDYSVNMTDSNVVTTDNAENISEQADLDADPYFFESANNPITEMDMPDETSAADELQEGTQAVPADSLNIPGTETDKEQETQAEVKELRFSSSSTLKWPVTGNILLNYSMDSTIYFPTLDVYKYNPAIVIASEVGTPILASAEGEVIETFMNEEIGKAVLMNLGDGYQLTYGQLDQITVKKGDYVETGEVIGYTAGTTKYYSLEGSNLYFMLTKDGTPVNPLSILE